MKIASLVLNIVLAIAVIYLYVLHFSQNGDVVPAEAAVDGTASGAIPQIAYVNSDTLLENYEFFQTKRVELEKRAEDLQKEYENRARGLQNEISNFQQNAGSMTMNQARAVEEDLRKKQQNLLQYQQNLSSQLLEEEGKVNDDLYERVSNFLEDYGKNKDFKLVLTYTKNSGVLYADDSLDITQQVVEGLNQVYNGTTPPDSTASE
ncbi:OmpH family outer membrane protein [Tunicatimonas pelagia]|uniref:OmpH family outer membrane protein n=1 Tax=Tunicatimonas pelagia TaxID=931531 RepID=UPI0026670EA8|nr:OmpH family outer membrane protein [Tunicatimonas pelagia]WKN43085.1 OmpH family outer membrane protein [Tunicatimonas pelagia]